MAFADTSVWIITDGKAGDLQQCLGICDHWSGITLTQKISQPRLPFSWWTPRKPHDPRLLPNNEKGPFAPPFPDIIVASGRRAIAPMMAIKEASKGQVFTAFLKDPRIGQQAADVIWVPEHDKLRGDNVIRTLLSPHRITQDALAHARENAPEAMQRGEKPRLGVLVGGNSRHVQWSSGAVAGLISLLRACENAGLHLMITTSRRTRDTGFNLIESLADFGRRGHIMWEGGANNPYRDILACSDALLVTGDSVNMVGEALAPGVPVSVYDPGLPASRPQTFINTLASQDWITLIKPENLQNMVDEQAQSLVRQAQSLQSEPRDPTSTIADAIWHRYERHRAQRST